MRCPYCGCENTQVKDSRPTEENQSIRRRRNCEDCGYLNDDAVGWDRCEGCGSVDVELISGEELLVEAIEVDDELVTTGRKGDGDGE